MMAMGSVVADHVNDQHRTDTTKYIAGWYAPLEQPSLILPARTTISHPLSLTHDGKYLLLPQA
jgi:hypothetical protein